MTAPAPEWQPGDPLYTRGTSGGSAYRTGLFTYRDESDLPTDCHCPDAASWPNPRSHRPLPEGDELADFISHWHWWQNQQETA